MIFVLVILILSVTSAGIIIIIIITITLAAVRRARAQPATAAVEIPLQDITVSSIESSATPNVCHETSFTSSGEEKRQPLWKLFLKRNLPWPHPSPLEPGLDKLSHNCFFLKIQFFSHLSLADSLEGKQYCHFHLTENRHTLVLCKLYSTSCQTLSCH